MGERGAGAPFGVAEVNGPSMVPTLRHGDLLLVRYGVRVRAGDVVVLRHPLQQDLLIVKRAVGRRAGGWWVLGDNAFAESDSRMFGAVPDELLLGRAVGRYRPRGDTAGPPAERLRWLLSAVRPLRRGQPPAASWRLRAR